MAIFSFRAPNKEDPSIMKSNRLKEHFAANVTKNLEESQGGWKRLILVSNCIRVLGPHFPILKALSTFHFI